MRLYLLSCRAMQGVFKVTVISTGQTQRLSLFVLAVAAFAAMCCHAAELPLEIQADRYLVRAERQFQAGDAAASLGTLDKILALQKNHGLKIPAAFWFKHAQASLNAKLFEQAVNSATQYLNQAGRDGEHFLAALEILDESESMKMVGHAFRDCEDCPEMVVVPEGTFMMGSNSDAADSDEKPVHKVTISYRFAVGKYEVTFREWDACVAAGGCNHRADDEGWGRGSRPVIRVSWHDAKEYVKWLSRKTGEAYRLLSESEWEYVARAGTTTAYHFGSSISPGQANYDENIGKTVAVGSYPPNAFGLA